MGLARRHSSGGERAAQDRLELFAARTQELGNLRLVRIGAPSDLTIRWDAVSQRLTYSTVEPDEEDLRSFLLSFRQFVTKGEPIFVDVIFNDCRRFLRSHELQEQIRKAHEEWKNAFHKMGAFHLVIDDREITGEYVLDLWINGYYFHNDWEKAARLRALMTDWIPLIRPQFLTVVSVLTQIILYLGSVVNYSLRENLFESDTG